MPEPLQSEPVTVPFEHVVAAHGVVFEAGRQPPAPLQKPSVTQLLAAGVQSLPGSVPAATLPHTPSEPPPFKAALQAWQGPLQAVLQHSPSTQKAPALQMLLPQQFTVLPTHCEPQQKLGLKQHWLVPGQCGSVAMQMASATWPSASSPGAPDAQA